MEEDGEAEVMSGVSHTYDLGFMYIMAGCTDPLPYLVGFDLFFSSYSYSTASQCNFAAAFLESSRRLGIEIPGPSWSC